MKLKCSKCKEFKTPENYARRPLQVRGYDYYCKGCRKEFVKTSRGKVLRKLANQRQAELHPKRMVATEKIRRMVEQGKLKKEPCFLCGTTIRIQGHHINYDFPHKVIWLCQKHHASVHYQTKVENYGK